MSDKINWRSRSVQRFFHNDVVNYGDGKYCVYIWLNGNDEPFYVGMGNGYRFHTVHEKCRSQEFMNIYGQGGCFVKIVAYGMNEAQARKFEKELILAYDGLGFKLVNKQYLVDYYHTPARMEFYKGRRRMTND